MTKRLRPVPPTSIRRGIADGSSGRVTMKFAWDQGSINPSELEYVLLDRLANYYVQR